MFRKIFFGKSSSKYKFYVSKNIFQKYILEYQIYILGNTFQN